MDSSSCIDSKGKVTGSSFPFVSNRVSSNGLFVDTGIIACVAVFSVSSQREKAIAKGISREGIESKKLGTGKGGRREGRKACC